MASFFDIDMESHLGEDNQLVKLNKLIDWKKFSKYLENIHQKTERGDGPNGYNPLKMFKCLLLSQWHNLSDPGLEESLRVRLDFLKFTGFSVGDKLPDETTFCRFRNKLIEQDKLDTIFNELNQQLELLGLKIKSAETAIVDATIISSQARPRKVLELFSEEGNKDNNQENNEEKQEDVAIKYSADPDARWLKKGKKYYFGYQAFARADAEGFVDKTHVTPANLAECKEFGEMVLGVKTGTRILADKGFFSAENKQILREKNLKNGLMYKGFRGNPLSSRKILFNKLISKKRWRIEQCFGTLKRRFLFTKSSYFTTKKVDAQLKMKMMCLNLLKALNKVKIA